MHHFHTKVPYQKPMLRKIEWLLQNGPITKNGVLPVTTSFFWKFCFSLRTFCKELIWCTSNPNVHIHIFCKSCNFIWQYFFPVSFLNWVHTSLYASFISVNFGKNMPDSCAAFRCTNGRSTTSLQFYRTPSVKSYPEQRIKWVTAMRKVKRLAKNISNAQVCSAYFATDKPS